MTLTVTWLTLASYLTQNVLLYFFMIKTFMGPDVEYARLGTPDFECHVFESGNRNDK